MAGRILQPAFCVIALLWAGAAAAQRNDTSGIELSIRITLAQGEPAQSMALEVELVSDRGSLVAQTSTNSGTVAFTVRPGHYRIRVSGSDIETQNSDTFALSSFESSHEEYVQVHLRNVPGGRSAPGGLISSGDLNVPKGARDAYAKGNDALTHNELKKAIEQFEKAIAQYPNYASAHGALGLALRRAGDRNRARDEFRRAIDLDKTLAPAYLQLGRLSLEDQEYAAAEQLLSKAVALAPSDVEALAYLGDAEFFQGKYQDVIAMARKLHAQNPKHGFAVIHFLAATALERTSRAQESAAEYRLFLQEDPGNRRAPLARLALARLEK